MKCKFSHTIENDIIIAKKQVSINIFLLEGNTISNTIKHKVYKIRKMIKTECLKCKVYHIIENEMTGVKKQTQEKWNFTKKPYSINKPWKNKSRLTCFIGDNTISNTIKPSDSEPNYW